MNLQTRLGAFVLIALITLALFSSKIGGFQWGEAEGTSINATFSDASGIDVQTPVFMAGVQVGAVESIILDNNQALVNLLIQPGIQLPASTRAHIAGGGLVGEKYISLRATAGDKKPLAGASIPVSDGGDLRDMISRASSLTEDANAFFNKAEKITDSINVMLDENRADIQTATHGLAQLVEENRPDIRSATHELAGAVKENRKQIKQLMNTLPKTAKAGETFFKEGTVAMRDLHMLMMDNRENLYRTLYELRLASEHIEAFSDDIRRNPWKLMKKKPEIKADKRDRQRRMEEMLMTTGRMGLEQGR
ncbi:MAG: MlaD family protein [Mariprofundus sp.]|nr:MlaD family protein [Mariprofundus sp.]